MHTLFHGWLTARAVCVAAALVVAALCVAGCSGGSRSAQFGGATMGTTWSVQIVAHDRAVDAAALRTDIAALLVDINAGMSTYQPDSTLSRFNASDSTDWFALPADVYEVLDAALRIGRQTGGAFDVTVGPAVNLWGFGPDGPRSAPPEPAEVEATRRRIGAQLLMLRAAPPAVRKARADVYVDLSAMAKGYAVDRIAAYLRESGVANFLVEVGGELSARGINRRGEPWAVAVEKPLAGERSVQRVVPLVDLAVATSGNYRNFFSSDGQRYGHTIDPRRGRPVQHALASATVVHSSAMLADGFATAMMALGPAQGMAVAEQRDLAVLLIEEVDGVLVERPSSAYRRLAGELASD